MQSNIRRPNSCLFINAAVYCDAIAGLMRSVGVGVSGRVVTAVKPLGVHEGHSAVGSTGLTTGDGRGVVRYVILILHSPLCSNACVC